jgi:hypothetical protein
VALHVRRANWGLLLLVALPANLVALWVRALRWRHLTDPIRPLPRMALSRATAVGFLANNVLPLRVGEVLRTLLLARQYRLPPAAVLGTVVIERVIDSWMVVSLLVGALWLAGDAGGAWQGAAVWLLPIAFLPALGLACLRLAPQQVRRVVGVPLRLFPVRVRQLVFAQLDRVDEGLGALRGGRHLFWIGWHALSIWLGIAAIPILAGFRSLGLAFPSAQAELAAGWVTLGALALAVALPSAPGFFGVYHSACRLALERFGFPAETAVAAGTLLHAVFWLTTSGLGLLALRGAGTRLGDLDPDAGP